METPDGSNPDPDPQTPSTYPLETPPAVPEPPRVPPIQPVVPVDPIKEIELDGDGNLADAVPCRRCSYTLTGLPPTALCPECALPIARSVLGDELRYCDPSWLRAVAQGIKIILIGIFSMIGMGILLMVAMTAYIFAVSVQSNTPPNMSLIMSASMVISVPMVIAIFGVWRMTTPDPGQIESEPPINARKLARWCILASLISTPLGLMTSQQMTITPGATMPVATLSPTMQALQWGSIGLGTVAMVGYVAVIVLLGRLAGRIPNPSLVGQAKIVMWGYGITQGITYAMGIVVNIMTPAFVNALTTNPNPQLPIGYIIASSGAALTGCVSFVFLIWAIVLMFLVYFAIKKEAVKAGENWGSA